MSDTLFLRNDDVADLATPVEFVDAVREGYHERGTGAPAEPRTLLTNDDPAGILTGYMAVLPDAGVMGGYMYAAGFESQDAHFALPLFDATSGEPLAVLDGVGMNPYKTGATGAVGVDALARDDASTLGLIGSGTQARGQLLATATVRDLEHVSVFSPTESHRTEFATAMDDELDASVEAVPTSEDAVVDSDIVVTATTASDPVFDGASLSPGTHVTVMGQYHPKKREIDAETVGRSTYVVDLRGRLERDAGAYIAAREAGEISPDHVHAELGSVVAGDQPGRQTADEITVFDSGGTAIETVAAAKMLYDRAVADGRGERIEFAPASQAFPGR
jgi:alanine dehydrogenase